MKIKQMSNGQFVLVQTVPTMLLTATQGRFKEPPPPTWKDEQGNEYVNTESPVYRDELAKWEGLRNEATIYAVALLGLKLCDEDGVQQSIPAGWDNDLRLLGVDWKSIVSPYFEMPKKGPIDERIEAAAYIVLACMGASDMYIIGICAGASEDEIDSSIRSFQRAAARDGDTEPAHTEADTK